MGVPIYKSQILDEEKNWFVLKNGKTYGPHTYIQVINMIQQKALFDFDYIWTQGEKTWKPVYEYFEFQSQNIHKFLQDNPQIIRNTLFERKHKRILKRMSILLHDNQTLWQGETLTLSIGGAGLVINNSQLLPDQEVHVHFRDQDLFDKSLDVQANILSKRYRPDLIQHNSIVQYCVEFKNCEETEKKILRDIINNN